MCKDDTTGRRGSPDRQNSSEKLLQPGLLLAERFRLIRHLGRGGLGHVWLAEDVQLNDEKVACKTLRKTYFYDRRAIADMKREVLLTRKLRHPNILAVYTFWETDLHRFITMEYVEGVSLSYTLQHREEPFGVHEILEWIGQVCGALDYAHKQQILHRDVKPGNILIDQTGQALLADFGIARTAREVRTRYTGEMTSGTLLYMSPEQLVSERLDARTDLYSLAATIYELLSGLPPFYEGSLITQIQMKQPSPITGVGEAVNAVLLKALSKSPDERQDSCGEFFREFEKAAATDGETGEKSTPTTKKPEIIHGRVWNPDAETVELYMAASERHKPRIGMLLIEAGILTSEQLEQALRVQEETEEKLGDVLVNLGYVAPDFITETLGKQLQVEFVRLDNATFDPDITGRIPAATARERRCIPINRQQGRIVIAMADPLDLGALNEIERLCKEHVDIRIAPERDINEAIDRVYGTPDDT